MLQFYLLLPNDSPYTFQILSEAIQADSPEIPTAAGSLFESRMTRLSFAVSVILVE